MDKNLTKLGLECVPDLIPSIPTYITAINIYGITLAVVSTIVVLLVITIFIDTLRFLMVNTTSSIKGYSAFIIAVYPTIALATYLAILVPRAHLLAEAVTQFAFMAGMYQLYCLFLSYSDGQNEVIIKSAGNTLDIKLPPCCCWPCCFCLPNLEINRFSMRYLRFLVLQLPIIQSFVYLVLLVMWAERESLYQVNYMYFQPIIVISILCGVWGMMVTMNLLQKILGDSYQLRPKYLVLQMVLIFAKLQGLITRSLVWTHTLPCNPPITPAVYANLIHNILMLMEMLILGYIARNLYKRPLPTPHWVTSISTIGSLMATDMFKNNNNQKSAKNLNQNLSYKNETEGRSNPALEITE